MLKARNDLQLAVTEAWKKAELYVSRVVRSLQVYPTTFVILLGISTGGVSLGEAFFVVSQKGLFPTALHGSAFSC